MPDLAIRFKKKSDGSAALSCTRADGTVTWQRQEGRLGQFFPLHDLTHLSVESVLGLRRAFYGLLVEGWDITGFAAPERRGELPHEALFAEVLVGYFDLERRVGERATANELNARAASYFANRRLPPPPISLTQDEVDQIRAVRAAHFDRWYALAPGETLQLSFDRSPQRSEPSLTATQTGGQRVG